jgi:DNA-binding CsgD family transcriptional regulator
MLARLFNLTPAEVEIAISIARGKRVPEIATDRGVTNETVRTQSKAAFAKTGTQNQVELTSLLTRLAMFGHPQRDTGPQPAYPRDDSLATFQRKIGDRGIVAVCDGQSKNPPG